MEIYKGLSIKGITVIDEKPTKENGVLYHLCKCICGNEKLIKRHTLQTQRIRDCGCGNYKLKEYIGLKFGKFTVIGAYRKRLSKVNIICICKCECGSIREIPYSNLKSGNRVSCGCVQKFDFSNYKNKIYNGIKILSLIDFEKRIVKCQCSCGELFEAQLIDITAPKRHIIGCKNCIEHKYSKKSKYVWNIKSTQNRLKGIYNGMLDRCYDTKSKNYRLYGGKGVKVCDEWKSSFDKFKTWALANGYEETLSIDRIDGNGNYEPSNCRWATMKQQQNNRCNNRVFNLNGEKYTLSELSTIYNINYQTLRSRLSKGMDILTSLNTPVRKR